MYCAYCVEDDLLRNLEFFDTEQEAIARFDEFDSSGGSGTGGGLPELTNEAWRVSQRSDELFAAGDRAALEELMHEDVIIHSTNQLRLRDVLDRQRFLDQWANVFESEGLPTRTTTTLLAVRGESLCLEEGVVEFGDAVTVMLQLTRVENGRIVELWLLTGTVCTMRSTSSNGSSDSRRMRRRHLRDILTTLHDLNG